MDLGGRAESRCKSSKKLHLDLSKRETFDNIFFRLPNHVAFNYYHARVPRWTQTDFGGLGMD